MLLVEERGGDSSFLQLNSRSLSIPILTQVLNWFNKKIPAQPAWVPFWTYCALLLKKLLAAQIIELERLNPLWISFSFIAHPAHSNSDQFGEAIKTSPE
jgi:hypothetical protein